MAETDDEQSICVQCGLCCDGTMFQIAWLTEHEKRSLGEMFEVEESGQRPCFRQPCPHSRDCFCAVYESRPQACRTYRCKTLRELSEGLIDRGTALTHIRVVKQALDDLRPLLGPGETLWDARRRRAAMLAERAPVDATQGTFVLHSAALDLLLERHFRTDDSRLFGSDCD